MAPVLPPREIPGQLSRMDMEAIAGLASRVPAGGVVVEVGSLYGLSSWIWAKNADPRTRIVCIDPWKHEAWIDKVRDRFSCEDLSPEAFRKNVEDCPNIEMIEGYSPDCADGWNTPIDIYFDDADHRNPGLRKNIDFWSQHVKLGGLACGHDYSEAHRDVIDEAERLSRQWSSPVSTSGSVWWVVRNR